MTIVTDQLADGIASITIDGEKANAITEELTRAIHGVLASLDASSRA